MAHPYHLTLHFLLVNRQFNDEEWPQAQASLTCVEKEKHARFRVPVPIKHEHHGDDHGEFSRKMLKASRTHYWYE